ncbi:MAG TPA: signal peptidase I [Actinomycetota bacterium]|jgi:signal peptidase I
MPDDSSHQSGLEEPEPAAESAAESVPTTEPPPITNPVSAADAATNTESLDPVVETEPPPAAPDEEEEDRAGSKNGKKTGLAFLKELPILLLIAFGLALLIKTFLVQAFYIPSESMEPTLDVGDRVLVNKVVYHLHTPRTGDIIVFEEPHPGPQPHRNPLQALLHWLTQGLGVSASPERDFIKRVIAVPGQTLEIKQGAVFVDGHRLTEPYLSRAADRRDYPPTKVPPKNLFVMGDNRTNSNDSRFGLGFIPYDKVVGRAFVIIWPPSDVSLIRRPG